MNKVLHDRDIGMPILDGIRSIADKYDFFILDVWGVLHDGIKTFDGTLACLEQLKQAGKSVCLLSNTPNSGKVISEHLNEMGIKRALYLDIVTAGDSANEGIKEYEGKACWYAGGTHNDCLLSGTNLTMTQSPDQADFIVNDLYDLSAEQKRALKPELQKAANLELPMICGNPDLLVNVGKDLKECPGTYALLYEEMGGKVIYHGKPHKPIYERAWAILEKPDKNKIVAIGDSLHTDIQGANGFGIDSVFNLSGIHREEVLSQHSPDDIDSEKLDAMISGQPHKPQTILNGFKW